MIMPRKCFWALSIIAAMGVGCGGETPPPTPDIGPPPGAPKPSPDPVKNQSIDAEKIEEAKPGEAPKTEETKPADAPKTASVKLSDDEIKAIKELPADEVEAALAQAKCPVSDEPLGAMGKPIKVVAEGKTFYICCKGCTKDVEADPKAILAKLGK